MIATATDYKALIETMPSGTVSTLSDDEMRFYALDFDRYVEIPHSELFPFLTPQTVVFFLHKGEEGAVAMAREFRKWVKAQVGKQQ